MADGTPELTSPEVRLRRVSTIGSKLELKRRPLQISIGTADHRETHEEANHVVVCHRSSLVSNLLASVIQFGFPAAHTTQVESLRAIYATFSETTVELLVWAVDEFNEGLLHDFDNLYRVYPRLRILLIADVQDGSRRMLAHRNLSVISSRSVTGPLLMGAIAKSFAASRLERPAAAVDIFAPPPVDTAHPCGSSSRRYRMSGRQAEVLALLAKGHSNKRIGVEMGLSENTVKSHVKVLMRKLGARNRTEAALIGLGKMSRTAAPKPAMTF